MNKPIPSARDRERWIEAKDRLEDMGCGRIGDEAGELWWTWKRKLEDLEDKFDFENVIYPRRCPECLDKGETHSMELGEFWVCPNCGIRLKATEFEN